MQTKQQGVTLIETIIFIVIVSIAVAAISQIFAQNVSHSADALLRQKAMVIAHRYLDQLQTVRWDETTPVGGGTATTQSSPGLDGSESCTLSSLDDFDDFSCYSNQSLGDGFTIDITVSNGTSTWASVPASKHKSASIKVTNPNGETLDITLFRADY